MSQQRKVGVTKADPRVRKVIDRIANGDPKTPFNDPRNAVDHPCRWTPDLLDEIERIIPPGASVHDPFAGTGERLGAVSDQLGWTFTGTEIEPEWIIDRRVSAGNATDAGTYPSCPYWIVTSPSYRNGMADHFAWNPPEHYATPNVWNTYRHALARTIGQDRELHPDNLGRWGARGADHASPKVARYFELAAAAARCWHDAVGIVLNVKDFIAKGKIVPHVDEWADVLTSEGFEIADRIQVRCPGNRHGQNGTVRVEDEELIIARPGESGDAGV